MIFLLQERPPSCPFQKKKNHQKPLFDVDHRIPTGIVNHRRSNERVKELLLDQFPCTTKYMGGVDLLLQQVDYVGEERPFHEFWKKSFFAIIYRIAYCACVLYVLPLTCYPVLDSCQPLLRNFVVQDLMIRCLQNFNMSTGSTSFQEKRKRTV